MIRVSLATNIREICSSFRIHVITKTTRVMRFSIMYIKTPRFYCLFTSCSLYLSLFISLTLPQFERILSHELLYPRRSLLKIVNLTLDLKIIYFFSVSKKISTRSVDVVFVLKNNTIVWYVLSLKCDQPYCKARSD